MSYEERFSKTATVLHFRLFEIGCSVDYQYPALTRSPVHIALSVHLPIHKIHLHLPLMLHVKLAAIAGDEVVLYQLVGDC